MSIRKFLGRFFGEENVLWAAGEGPEPADAELERRLVAANQRQRTQEAEQLCLRWAQRQGEIAVVRRVMEAAERGEETGLAPELIARLPELLERLGGVELPDPFAPDGSQEGGDE